MTAKIPRPLRQLADRYGAGTPPSASWRTNCTLFGYSPPGSWSEPINPGKSVNYEFSEYRATITPDGKYLFFTGNRNGSEDIFWFSTEIIEELK